MKLYNTMSRSVEEFVPLTDKDVRIYTCGLTVYSQPHIGNWVGYIYWDVLHRVLANDGFNVIRTQNYTDVGHLVSDDDDGEDKMEKGARAEGLSAWDVADKYIKIAEDEGYNKLGLLRPTNLVRATDYIDQQVDFVQQLEAKGYTYEIPDEGIYFDTSKLQDYGKLARLDIKGLQAGARVEIEGKRNITDFALWKFSPKDQKRDMEWESPWGKGFPGWHLECSVIAKETLGDQIDIHTGGIDHIPVHHTNEIAQTESLTNKPFSKFWAHNNHLKVDGGKMAKSLGNIYTLDDIINKNISIDAFKLMILSKHYRTEGNFTWEILEAAQNRLNHWLQVADLRWQVRQPKDFIGIEMMPTTDEAFEELEQNHPHTVLGTEYTAAFVSSLNEDLNTPKALMSVDSFIGLVERDGLTSFALSNFTQLLQYVQQLLGLDLFREDISDDQKDLLAQRSLAREHKDWSKSDEIRDELLKQGISVQDASYGQIWSRA